MAGLALLPGILFVYVGAIPTEKAYDTTIGTTGQVRLIGFLSRHFPLRQHYGDHGDRGDYWSNRNCGDYLGHGNYGDRH